MNEREYNNPLDEPLERLESNAEGPVRAAWALKRYRKELIEAGALVPGLGRTPSFYRPQLWRRTLDMALTREAQERLAREEAAA